ncbi:MAG: GTP-binding protein [Synechococcus sp.]
MSDISLPRLPVTLIVGFEHSGKSTLISSLLQHLPDPTAQIGTEAERSPTSCICCSGSDALHQALKTVLEHHQNRAYSHLFVEGSHETDPVPVMRAIRNRFGLTPLVLSNIITVMNAVDYPPKDAPPWLVTNQLFFADRIALTHCDLATPEQVFTCQQAVNSTKGLPIIQCQPGNIPLNRLLAD